LVTNSELLKEVKKLQLIFECYVEFIKADVADRKILKAAQDKEIAEKQRVLDAHNVKVFACNELAFALNARLETLLPRQEALATRMEDFLSIIPRETESRFRD
jgi:hypothetical protein